VTTAASATTTTITASSTTTTTAATTTNATDDPVQSPEDPTETTILTDEYSSQINTAGEWAATYTSTFASQASHSLSKSQLRAYALWHHGALDVGDIARIWRDPPLKEGTVATYILDAIRIEKLPCDVERAKAAHEYVPSQMKDKFRSLMAELE
jgi:hypothetical protein